MKGWTDTVSTTSGIKVSPNAHDHLSTNQKAKLLGKRQQAERKRQKARELEEKRRLLREEYNKRRDESIKSQKEAVHPTSTSTHTSTSTSIPTSTSASTSTSTPKKSVWNLKHSAAVGTGSVAGGAGGYFLTRRLTRNMQPGYKRRLLRVAGTAAGAGLGGYATHRLTK
jgi:hypothetical protein